MTSTKIVIAAAILCIIVGGLATWHYFGIAGLVLFGSVCAVFTFVAGLTALASILPPLVAEHFIGFPFPRGVAGVFVPFGWKLMLDAPSEFRALTLAAQGKKKATVQLLRASRGLHVGELGLADRELFVLALETGQPAFVLEQAAVLAREYGAEDVLLFSRHSSGVLRGFDFLREGIPYEFAEVLA